MIVMKIIFYFYIKKLTGLPVETISPFPSKKGLAAPISLLRPYLSPYTNFQLHKELVVLLKPQQNVGAQ